MLHVTAAVLQHRGRVLLARRTAPEWLAGQREFPGGKIEPGEAPREALARLLSAALALAAARRASARDRGSASS